MKAIWDSFYNNAIVEIAGDFYLLARILISSFCGAAIGYERSRRQKDAGIRTHMIVALGSALAIVVSKYGFFDVIQKGLETDASRIAANVVTGVGFLGAGVIFVKDVSIRGLTTAAGIWTTAGVGLAIGAGMYTVGIGATVLMVLVQFVFHKFFSRLENTSNEFVVVVNDSPNVVKSLHDMLKQKNVSIEDCKMVRNKDSTITLDVTIKKARTMTMEEILLVIEQNEDVVSVTV